MSMPRIAALLSSVIRGEDLSAWHGPVGRLREWIVPQSSCRDKNPRNNAGDSLDSSGRYGLVHPADVPDNVRVLSRLPPCTGFRGNLCLGLDRRRSSRHRAGKGVHACKLMS